MSFGAKGIEIIRKIKIIKIVIDFHEKMRSRSFEGKISREVFWCVRIKDRII